MALESRGALKVLNVPERDDRIGDRLNAYQNTRYASFQGFSGINDGIFINTRFADSNQVFVKFQYNFQNFNVLYVLLHSIKYFLNKLNFRSTLLEVQWG